MSKKLAVGVILVVIVALVFVANFLGFIHLFSLYGFTTLSLSEAQFNPTGTTLPSGTFWTGKVWVLSVSQDGFAQRASGTISPNVVGQKSGETPQKDFFIEMDFQKQSCEYPLYKEEGIPALSDFSLQRWTLNPFNFDADVRSHCPNLVISGSYPALLDAWCVNEIPLSSAIDYNIENPYTHTISSVIVGTPDGWEQAYEIDTQKSQTISGFITPEVYVRWTGYHGTDFQCNSQGQVFGYWTKDTGLQGTWKIGNRNLYETYKQYYNTLKGDIQNVGSSVGTRADDVLPLVSRINNQKNAAMQRVTSFGSIEQSSSPSVQNAVVVNDIPSPIKFPQYVFYVKADYLGVEVMEPNIQVVSARQVDNCFEGAGSVEITLSNSGHDGSSYVSVENCPAGFSNIPASVFGVNNGQTTTITRTLSASVDTQTTGTCTVKSNDGFHVSTKTFNVCAKPFRTCTAGTKQCSSDDKILQCNSEGTGWNTLADCRQQCNGVCDNSKMECNCQTCTTDEQCDDVNPCTTDKCVESLLGNSCSHTPLNTPECDGEKCPPIVVIPGIFSFPDVICLLTELVKTLFWIAVIIVAVVVIAAILIVIWLIRRRRGD